MPLVTGSLAPDGAVVELTVGVDQARRTVLLRNNFSIPVRVRVPAQIDTGSDVTGVFPEVLTALDLRPVDTLLIRTPSTVTDPHPCNVFLVSLGLTDSAVEMHLPSVRVIECPFTPEERLRGIIGRDVLKDCLFVYDGRRETFALAF